jgi:thiamine pyrophosphate-dependent acetolactate synthase large subunit-like protein
MKNLLKTMPWLALLALAVISVPRSANTAPPDEPHPHIRAAVRELREARRELLVAGRDFCGHRAEAAKQADDALRQLQAALDCDKK